VSGPVSEQVSENAQVIAALVRAAGGSLGAKEALRRAGEKGMTSGAFLAALAYGKTECVFRHDHEHDTLHIPATDQPETAETAATAVAEPARAIGEGTALTERERVYDFGGGRTVILTDVRELVVRDSGTHRITTADGRLHIIATGWLAIHIDTDGRDWTV
jgi:hypothetical protein